MGTIGNVMRYFGGFGHIGDLEKEQQTGKRVPYML